MAMRSLGRLRFHFKEAIAGIRNTGFMNIATITTVALSLFILGMFLLFLRNLNEFLDDVRTQYQVVLFLEHETDARTCALILSKIQADPDVIAAVVVPRNKALQEIRDELAASGSILPSLKENPLPDCIEFHVREGANFAQLLARCRAMPGVGDVSRGQEWVGKIMQIVRLVRFVGLVLVLILGTAALLIVSNTIKLTVYARRQEIEIMRLVGATNWFIRIPFLIEGLLQGLAGSLIAVIILMSGYQLLIGEISAIAPFISIISDTGELTKLSAQIVSLGVVLGLLGSLLSLRRILV